MDGEWARIRGNKTEREVDISSHRKMVIKDQAGTIVIQHFYGTLGSFVNENTMLYFVLLFKLEKYQSKEDKMTYG